MSSPSKGAIPPAPSPTWRFELLHPGCVHQTQFITKSFFLFIDSISVFLLLVLSGRLLRHRWKAQRRREERWGAQAHEGDGGEKEGSAAGKRTWERWQWYWTAVLGCGTGGRTAATTTRTTIGDLLERLVLKLCMWELLFYVVDYVYLLDCNAPTAIGITAATDTVLHPKTLSFYLVKEGLAMFILWLHGTIAYTLYAYTVQKISPARLLRNQRIWAMALCAALYMGTHALLSLTLRRHLLGYFLGRLSYNALVIPISLTVIARWYWHVIVELTRGGDGHAPLHHHHHHQSPTAHGGAAAAAPALDLESGGSPAAAASISNTPRIQVVAPLNRRLALRLLMILGTTVTLWTLLFLVDIAAWAHSKRGHRDTPLLVMVSLRSALARCVGFFDAIILGMDASCLGNCCARWWYYRRRRQGRERGATSPTGGGGVRGTFSGEEEEEEEGVEVDGERALGSEGEPASFLARPMLLRHNRSSHSLLPHTRSAGGGLHMLGGSGASSGSLVQLQVMQQPADVSPEEEANVAMRAAEALRRMRTPPVRPKGLRLFVTTWNMGGVDLDAPITATTAGPAPSSGIARCADVLARLLPRWIPRGLDLYCIGVQECASLPRLREVLRAYLNGNDDGHGGGGGYAMYKTEIGDEHFMHGFIALTLFVREADVACGAFRLHRAGVRAVATGRDLGPMLGRAANKGTTGLSCRYHDATLAFLGTHFSSDKKGKNRLLRRNRDAATALRELALVWDAGPDVDVQCLHRFTFLLGDLNYRNLASPQRVLRRVARSARRMATDAGANGGSKWRTAAYSRMLLAAAAGGGGGQGQMEEEGEEREEEGEDMLYLPYAPPAPALARALGLQQRPTTPVGRPSLWRRGVVARVSSDITGSGGGAGVGGLRWFLESGIGGSAGGLSRSRTEQPSPLSPFAGGGGVNGLFDSSNGNGGSGGLEPPVPVPLAATYSTSSFSSPASPKAGGRAVRLAAFASGEDEEEDEDGWIAVEGGGGGGGGGGGPFFEEEDDDDSDSVDGNEGEGGPWAWVWRVDELTLSRRGRLTLWGFREKPIAWPPSYRWHRRRGPFSVTDNSGDDSGDREGLAGDFTSVLRLARDAYTIAPPPLPLPPSTSSAVNTAVWAAAAAPASSSRARRASTASSSGVSASDSNGAGATNEEGDDDGKELEGGHQPPPTLAVSLLQQSSAGGGVVGGKDITRTPSYTDRILTHAQPGHGQALSWVGYEMADAIEFSDHRPVAAAFCVEVDGAVRGFELLEGARKDDLAVFTLRLCAPVVEWWEAPPLVITADGEGGVEGQQQQGQEERRRQPHEAVILFPLVSEDPLADARLATALGEALPGRSGGGGKKRSRGLRKQQVELTTSAQRHVRWGAFPLCFQVVASKRFSEHVVIKLHDERGQDLGQAVIPVVLGQPPPTTLSSLLHLAQQPPPTTVPRRPRFPLVCGGVFKGWLTVELKVETSPLKR